MSTKTKAQAKIDIAQFTKELKQKIAQQAILDSKQRQLRAEIYKDCFVWVQFHVSAGNVSTLEIALASLADTINVHKSTAAKYYYHGLFMHEHKLPAKNVDPAGVVALHNSFNSLTRSAQLKGLQVLRDNLPRTDLFKIIHRDKLQSGSEASKRAARIRRSGDMTETRMKMELLALATLMKAFYKTDVDITVSERQTGEILLSND